jgi:hypothetical protein
MVKTRPPAVAIQDSQLGMSKNKHTVTGSNRSGGDCFT